MKNLQVQVELAKLAHELGVTTEEVAFLGVLDAADLAALRALVTHALFAPHEHRFGRMAAFAKLIPASMAAKGAEHSLGPYLAARAAAVTEPDLAVRMSSHLSPAFLARMAPHLDPAKVAGIVSRLPADLVVDVGHRLVADQQYVPLGRFVSHVPVETALRVVDRAEPLDLLQVALFTEEASALDAVIAQVPEPRLAAVLTAASEADRADEALTLLSTLTVTARTRMVRIAAGLDTPVRDSLIRAVARHDAWEDLVPVLEHLDTAEALDVLDVPALRDPEVLAGMEPVARRHPAAGELFDQARRALLS